MGRVAATFHVARIGSNGGIGRLLLRGRAGVVGRGRRCARSCILGVRGLGVGVVLARCRAKAPIALVGAHRAGSVAQTFAIRRDTRLAPVVVIGTPDLALQTLVVGGLGGICRLWTLVRMDGDEGDKRGGGFT